jgi:hypothetical protein
VLGFLSRVPRFKQGGLKFKQGAAPCFSNVGRTLLILMNFGPKIHSPKSLGQMNFWFWGKCNLIYLIESQCFIYDGQKSKFKKNFPTDYLVKGE